MKCQVVHVPFGGRCGGTADLHVRVLPLGHGSYVDIAVCRFCGAMTAIFGFIDAVVVAAHLLAVPCRHPDGEWDDDGCVLPVTTDTVEDVNVDVGVPA